ncbi:hypothetical protein PRIPAC_78445 [Pristionchus pacificus]|uniref:Uncharacterized protein n=1 Tax=Pristionchus pacificus TaxID=54126 RepID=A0A2A6CJX8_PRIPA|nr:hypothetical protein PRIPAC_78445 [Pristionchus pacificus]|eukprot:PDM78388.1 hypothetical protein PRIPAC_30967 [Pristionchus pacificus]
MNDFSDRNAPNYYGYPPGPANLIQHGKRPMSSISPIVLFNTTDMGGKRIFFLFGLAMYSLQVKLAVGGAGGSMIISGVATIAMRTLFMGWSIKELLSVS